MHLTRAKEEQLKSILAAIAATNESTKEAFAEVKESTEVTNAVNAYVKESTNDAIAVLNESINAAIMRITAAVSEIKEMTSEEIEKVSDKVKAVKESTNATIRDMEERIRQLETKGVPKEGRATNVIDCSTVFESIYTVPATIPRPKVKASIFDGKSAWSVYKTQLYMFAAANGWSGVAKAYNLVASLRAADVVLTIPEDRRTD